MFLVKYQKWIKYHKQWIKHLVCLRDDSIYIAYKYAVDIINKWWLVNIATHDKKTWQATNNALSVVIKEAL